MEQCGFRWGNDDDPHICRLDDGHEGGHACSDPVDDGVCGASIADLVGCCLICGNAPDAAKDEHAKAIIDDASGVHVCVECVTRTRTVTSFGLTVQELTIAAKEYKERWIATCGQLPKK